MTLDHDPNRPQAGSCNRCNPVAGRFQMQPRPWDLGRSIRITLGFAAAEIGLARTGEIAGHHQMKNEQDSLMTIAGRRVSVTLLFWFLLAGAVSRAAVVKLNRRR